MVSPRLLHDQDGGRGHAHEPIGGAAVGNQDLGEHGDQVSSASGLKVGWNHFCAISVGTTALPITAVTRIVYCSWLMMWLVRPKSAEIEPKVRPVDMRSVVYMPSRFSNWK